MKIEIRENAEIKLENLLSCRKEVYEVEVNKEFANMTAFIKKNKLNQHGGIITTVHNIYDENEKKLLDIEILIPVDIKNSLHKYKNSNQLEKSFNVGDYKFIKSLHLENGLYATHKGNPELLNTAYDMLNQYITENSLKTTTPIYNIYRNKITSSQSIDDLIIDLFIGVQSIK